jgi:hypothetical protein
MAAVDRRGEMQRSPRAAEKKENVGAAALAALVPRESGGRTAANCANSSFKKCSRRDGDGLVCQGLAEHKLNGCAGR